MEAVRFAGWTICGMDLVPAKGAPTQDKAVAVSPEMIQTMGIRTALVGTSDFTQSLRAYGTVEPNTRLESMAASRLEGWKESLIERLTETREVIERMPVYAESAGVVTELMVRDGDYLKPGDPVVKLQAYEKVWVIASVPESDLPSMSIGKTATLKFESAPDAAATGTVDYIYPTIDTKTRTARVRISVDNSAGSLRPGAYADIVFDVDPAETPDTQLSIPSQAVLRDSRGSHVILALGDGRFESRDITIGASVRARTEVLSGLSAGDRIVASGQFMLDSESNLREGFSKLSAPAANFDGSTPLSELPIDATTLSQIDHMVDTALYFHEALIDGYAIDPYFLDPTLNLGTATRGLNERA